MGDLGTKFLTRAVEWLRAGYPTGVPRQDYVALLGLLRRELTEDDVRRIAVGLADQSLLTGDDPITTEEDVVRVSARLAAGGRPLAD